MASYAALKERVDNLIKKNSGALTFSQAFKSDEAKHRVRSAIKRKIRYYRGNFSVTSKDAECCIGDLRELKAKLADFQPLRGHKEARSNLDREAKTLTKQTKVKK